MKRSGFSGIQKARKGGIAFYLPVWHLDIEDFLSLRLKTGSQEKRAHSIFNAVCFPDEFWRRLENGDIWTTVDPYEVKQKLGLDINRLYDQKRLEDGEEPNEIDHAFTYNYRNVIEKADLELKKVQKAADIYKHIFKARKTGGTPFIYNSDTAARNNVNDHAGMPLSSNLCTEIFQNMTFDTIKMPEMKESGVVIQMKQGEGLVTCNLSSLVLQNVIGKDVDLQRVKDIQHRMLDNVITLNRTPVPQATHTNNLYRAVGAGGLGLATLLADQGIQWESEEAAEYVDKLFEDLAFADITASHKLSVEKGAYPLFEGSRFHTGQLFDDRGYDSLRWRNLKEKVMREGVRSGYLQAYAPTGL